MKSRATPRFWRLYRELPAEVQQLASRAFDCGASILPILPFDIDDSVTVKMLLRPAWETITGRWSLLNTDTVEWFWIGTHAEYNRLVRA